MAENVVENYGWHSSDATYSTSYVAPSVLALLRGLGARRVVDLGAGNGGLCALIAATGAQAVGVEYDKAGVEVARSAHPNLRFYNLGVQDDPQQLMASEEPFDVAVSTEVVEHLFSPHLLPRFAHAMLRPSGRLIVSTPYHGYLKNLALSVANGWDAHHTALWHGGHIKFWSRKTLTTLLQDNGFVVERFQGMGRAPYLWKSMLLVALKV